MGIEWSEESNLKKELRKWEKPWRFQMYPRMLYRPRPNPLSGKYEVSITQDVLSLDKTVVILSAQEFNGTCQLIVNDEAEHKRAYEDGWRDSQQAAMDYHNGLENEKAVEAAVRAFNDSKMSEAAQAEAKAADEATYAHLPEIPEKPIKRGPGRPRKIA